MRYTRAESGLYVPRPSPVVVARGLRDIDREAEAYRRRHERDAWLRDPRVSPFDAWEAAVAVVGVSTNASDGTTAGSLAVTRSMTAGNSAVIFSTWGDTSGTVTVSSDKGDSFSAALETVVDTADGQSGRVWTLLSAVGGSTVFTVSFTPNEGYRGIAVVELSGVTAQSGHNSQYQAAASGTDGISAGSITPSASPGKIIALSLNSDGANHAPTAGTGFTSESTCWPLSGSNDARIVSKSTTGSAISATFTPVSGTNHYITMAVVMTGGGGGAVVYNAPFFGMNA